MFETSGGFRCTTYILPTYPLETVKPYFRNDGNASTALGITKRVATLGELKAPRACRGAQTQPLAPTTIMTSFANYQGPATYGAVALRMEAARPFDGSASLSYSPNGLGCLVPKS